MHVVVLFWGVMVFVCVLKPPPWTMMLKGIYKMYPQHQLSMNIWIMLLHISIFILKSPNVMGV